MPQHLSEDDVSSSVLRFLQNRGWAVAHYHPPGGQATITLYHANGNMVVPDLVAYHGDKLLTVESKGAYAPTDIRKLVAMMEDEAVRHQLAEVVRRHAQLSHQLVSPSWTYQFAHAFSGRAPATPPAEIHLIQVANTGVVASTLFVE